MTAAEGENSPTLCATSSQDEAENWAARRSLADDGGRARVAGRGIAARLVIVSEYRHGQLRPGRPYAPRARRAGFA